MSCRRWRKKAKTGCLWGAYIAGLCLPQTAWCQTSPTNNATASPHDTVTVVDLSPKFLTFYSAALAAHADPEQRWLLWKAKYDFAAVPPIAAGQKIAREHLDEGWSQYPAAFGRIQMGASGLKPPPQPLLESVVALLGTTQPVHIRLIAFVGTFHREAFATGLRDGVSTIAIPLEDSDEQHTLDMTHEFTHAVQMQQGNWSGHSVGSSLFAEGLAMRVAEQILPGATPNTYTASSPEWMQQCTAELPTVLEDLRPHLDDQGADAVSLFIYGSGTTGLKREVYCGGWFVLGRLLHEGHTFKELGNLSRPDAERMVGTEVDQMLAQRN